MQQNKELRNKHTHIWTIHLQPRSLDYTVGKTQESPISVVGELNSYMKKNETGPNLQHMQKLNQNELLKTLM